MDPVDPKIRSAITKELLSVVRSWEPGPASAVQDTIGGEAVASIDRAAPIGWMDFALHMQLSDAIRAEVGSAGNVETWSQVFFQVSRRPLLDSFFSAMFRISGSPSAAFKGSARVFNLTHRGAGTYTYTALPGERSGQVALTGFPTRFTVDCYAEGLLGALRAVMDRSKAEGSAEIERIDRTKGDVYYTLQW